MRATRELIKDIVLKNVGNRTFENKSLYNVQAKDIEIQNKSFRYSLVDFCYFHKVTFINCDFTGCIVMNTNLRSSKFIRCKFDFSRFENTILPYNEVLQNLPIWENVRLQFLQNLRVNAENIGDRQIVEKIILLEADTQMIHFKKAYKHKESYYIEKYQGVERIKSFFKFLEMRFAKSLWNHGYSYSRILIVVAFFIFFAGIPDTIRIIDTGDTILYVIRSYISIVTDLFRLFIDHPNSNLQHISRFVVTLTLLARYLSIGLIVNVSYMKNLRK